MSRGADDSLDLSGVPCPANAARAIMRLDGLDAGQTLELLLDDGEPIANVPAALEQEGHEIIIREKTGERWRLVVKKN